MALFSQSQTFLFGILLLFSSGYNLASATIFTIQNHCNYTVWPGTLSGNGIIVGGGGFSLPAGSSRQLAVPAGWSGRFWGRTGCVFDGTGSGKCTTGDCAGGLKCIGGGEAPATLAEFTIGPNGGKDFYDVSLVDGYNIELVVQATGGTGECQFAGCVADLNSNCPNELQVRAAGGAVVACKSACAAFNKPEYCCTGDYSTPKTCKPTHYSQIFKNACPHAYSYAYDDLSSTCTCSGSNYVITFCPKH